VPQPGRGEVEGRLAVREGANHSGAPSDLAQDVFKWVVGTDAPAMLLREAVVADGLLEARCRKLGGSGQTRKARGFSITPEEPFRAPPSGNGCRIHALPAVSQERSSLRGAEHGGPDTLRRAVASDTCRVGEASDSSETR
jgi:hypothetical protein